MRRLRRSCYSLLGCWLWMSSAGHAPAQLLIAEKAGDEPGLVHAELAFALGDGPPVTWLSLRVARGPVALVAALEDEALAEPALDAWFAALEESGSPRVFMPSAAPDCKGGARFAAVTWPRGAGAAETALALSRAEDVRELLAEQGLRLAGELPRAPHYAFWYWSDDAADHTTRSVRFIGGRAPLHLEPSGPFPVVVSAITRAPARFSDEVSNTELRVTFLAGSPPRSDYRAQLLDWIARRPEPLLETRSRGSFFDWTVQAGSIALSPLVHDYARRAAQELAGLDAEACAEQLGALRDPSAPSASSCGEARDVELALRAVSSEQLVLQRFVVSGEAAISPELLLSGGELQGPALRATLLDRAGCESDPAPPATASPSEGGRGSLGSGSPSPVVDDEPARSEAPPAEFSCGSSTQSGQGGDVAPDERSDCSSDSSGASQADSGCSGDGSSTNEDSGCSGDGSSTNEDSGCSGDGTATSDSGDSGCGAGSDQSGGYEGDTCTGSAAPGAERKRESKTSSSVSPLRRPRRLSASLWTIGLSALTLPLRRRKRRGRADPAARDPQQIA